MRSIADNALLSVQTKPNNFQISLDVFPENVFQDASEWFDVACWGQVKPLAHEVIAAKAMLLLKEHQFDDAFELLLSGTSGEVMDAQHYAMAFTVMPSYRKLKPSSSPEIYGWEHWMALTRSCR